MRNGRVDETLQNDGEVYLYRTANLRYPDGESRSRYMWIRFAMPGGSMVPS